MMNCNICGTQIDNAESYCPVCGAQIRYFQHENGTDTTVHTDYKPILTFELPPAHTTTEQHSGPVPLRMIEQDKKERKARLKKEAKPKYHLLKLAILLVVLAGAGILIWQYNVIRSDYRRAYWDYLQRSEERHDSGLLAVQSEKPYHLYTYCPDRILIKDFDQDDTPELFLGYWVKENDSTEYVIRCLSFKHNEVSSTIMIRRKTDTPLLNEGIEFGLMDQMMTYKRGDEPVHSTNEDRIKEYVFCGNYKKGDENQKAAYEMVGIFDQGEMYSWTAGVKQVKMGFDGNRIYVGLTYEKSNFLSTNITETYYGYADASSISKNQVEIMPDTECPNTLTGVLSINSKSFSMSAVEMKGESIDEKLARTGLDVKKRHSYSNE